MVGAKSASSRAEVGVGKSPQVPMGQSATPASERKSESERESGHRKNLRRSRNRRRRRKRMPRKADPIIGDPNDPQGMVALMEQFFEWMRVRNYCRADHRHPRATTSATSSTGAPPAASPSRPKSPSRSSSATSGSCIHYRKQNGDPLELRQPDTAGWCRSGLVQLAGPQQPHPLQPGRRHRTAAGWNTGCRSAC